MSYHYSPSVGGFLHSSLHAAVPPDAVPITDAEHAALLAGQSAGYVIAPGPDGAPTLTERAPPEPGVPLSITRLQAWLQCLDTPAPDGTGYDNLWDWAEAYAAAPERSAVERAHWHAAQHWRRDDPRVIGWGAAAGLDAAAIDALFAAAAAR